MARQRITHLALTSNVTAASARRRRLRLVVALLLGSVLFATEAWFSPWTLAPFLALVLALLDGSLSAGLWTWADVTTSVTALTAWFTGATLRTFVMLFFLQDFQIKRVLLGSYFIDLGLLTVLLFVVRVWGPS